MTALARSRFALAATVALVAPTAVGCLEDVPSQPSWQVDVMPIIRGNCIRCHGAPPLDFATIRLDGYGPIPVVGGTAKGAGDAQIARNIIARVDPGEFDTNQRMPPGRELGLFEIETLRNWVALSGVSGPPRGPARPGNRPPTAVAAEIARDGATITYAYEVTDPDDDLVVGWVAGPPMGDDRLTVGELLTGRGQFAWDTSEVPAGTYHLTARLDDGADVDGPDATADYVEVELATITLPLVPP